MQVKMSQMFDDRLQGEPNGRRAFVMMCEKLEGTKVGDLVTLDFSEIRIVTASWLSAMLLPLYRWAAAEQTDLYFVLIYGSDKDWLDDLRLVARHNRKFFLIRAAAANTSATMLIGPVEEADRRTLQKVAELGEATGAMLERECPEEAIKATGWNNRLKELHEKRVLRRSKRGREQIYYLVEKSMTIVG